MTSLSILKLVAKSETDLVVARYRARQIAEMATMATIEQTRMVTAVSEIVRNAITHAGEARIEFNIQQVEGKQFVEVIVSDRGPGFPENGKEIAVEKKGGIWASRKIMNELTISSDKTKGATVRMSKAVGRGLKWMTDTTIEEWICTLKKNSPFSVVEDLEQQNKQLIDTLTELQLTRVRLEERTEQLNQANKYKGEFLANMSHEIRTPMNAVIGMSNILDRTELSDEQRKYLRLIKNASGSLLDIINDILDFSKIEAGKLVIENINFDLYDVVENCAELLSTNAYAKNLALIPWIDTNVPRQVVGDYVRLRQILVNLITNGIKFTDCGEIIVRVRLLNQVDDNFVVRFEVTDSGIGLTAEKQRSLFKPFVQADGSTTRKYGGTGLGLSICKQLAELMNGSIGVDSVEGAGSTFWFELPFTVGQKSESVEKPLKFARALIVDDHAPMREMAAFLLKSWQLENHSASSAIEALRLIENTNFDLFILDYLMPEMNGLELVAKIKSMERFRNSRIILLTALHEDGLGERAIAAGCDAFLTKPVRQSQLYDCLQSLGETGTYKATVVSKQSTSSSTPMRTQALQSSTVEADSNRNVLLVEDNPTNQLVAGIELETLGFSVVTANNGSEAVEMIKQRDFAIVFMDCQMPVMDGYEATRAVRKHESKTGKHVPIVAMTANAMEGDKELCLSAGMDDYITKPFQTEDLVSVVERWFNLDTVGGAGQSPPVDSGSKQASKVTTVFEYEKLRSKFTEKQAHQLLTVFLADTESKLPEIEALVENRDYDALAKLSHSIKGAASMIFAEGLAVVARDIEAAAKAQDASVNYPQLYADLSQHFNSLKVLAAEILSLKTAE